MTQQELIKRLETTCFGLDPIDPLRLLVDDVIAALAQPEQEPVALKWQRAPIRTAWGDEMVVASVAIDKDHTVCLYCERDQTPKVDAMFAQRTWVGLTDEEIKALASWWPSYDQMPALMVLAKDIQNSLKEKNT